MSKIELMILATTPGLQDALATLEGVEVIGISTPQRALSLLESRHSPNAIYIEDTFKGTIDELWMLVRAASGRAVPLMLNLLGPGIEQAADFRAAGVSLIEGRTIEPVVAQIARTLGVRRRAFAKTLMIAITAVKGGVGKTLLTAMIAEGLRMRGARVLIIDNDLSNSGLRPTFRIPTTAPTYTQLIDDRLGMAAWTPERVRGCVYHHQGSGLDFLLGPEEMRGAQDLDRQNWYAFFQALRQLDGYDVFLFDTSPEVMKRPVAYIVAREGGFVVLPAPPGRKERTGVLNLLRVLKGDQDDDMTGRALLVGMEPEKGVIASLQEALPMFAREAPQATLLGTLLRDPKIVSTADADEQGYLSPLMVAPHSKFAGSVHSIVDTLASAVSLPLPHPRPRSSLFQRMLNSRPKLPMLPAIQQSSRA